MNDYGTDKELHDLAARVLDVHPDRELIDEEGALYIAQMAITTGARFFPPDVNEIQVYQDGGEVLFHLGVNFYRRVATEQGNYFLFPRPRQMDSAERNRHMIKGDNLGFICGVVRYRDMERMPDGFSFTDYLDHMSFQGTAVVTAQEMSEGSPPKGRTWHWLGEKRAEKDALSKAFPIPLVGQRPVEIPRKQRTSDEDVDVSTVNEDLGLE